MKYYWGLDCVTQRFSCFNCFNFFHYLSRSFTHCMEYLWSISHIVTREGDSNIFFLTADSVRCVFNMPNVLTWSQEDETFWARYNVILSCYVALFCFGFCIVFVSLLFDSTYKYQPPEPSQSLISFIAIRHASIRFHPVWCSIGAEKSYWCNEKSTSMSILRASSLHWV